jgi:hypothetical protein
MRVGFVDGPTSFALYEPDKPASTRSSTGRLTGERRLDASVATSRDLEATSRTPESPPCSW